MADIHFQQRFDGYIIANRFALSCLHTHTHAPPPPHTHTTPTNHTTTPHHSTSVRTSTHTVLIPSTHKHAHIHTGMNTLYRHFNASIFSWLVSEDRESVV